MKRIAGLLLLVIAMAAGISADTQLIRWPKTLSG